jgi:hypothetical protein
MKKRKLVFILTTFLFAFNSCNSLNSESGEHDKSQRVDTIFLGITFGMSESEYGSHIEKKRTEGKIQVLNIFGASEKLYEFDFGADKKSARYGYASLHPTFENNSLWELTLKVKGKREFDLPVVQHGHLEELYKEKYGKFEYGDIDSMEDIWEFENMSIRLYMGRDACYIVYTDLDKKEEFENSSPSRDDL